MPRPKSVRKPGPKTKPKSAAEADISELESKTSKARTRISGKDRLFIRHYTESGFKDPDLAASLAGFREKYIGHKLVGRLADLIEAERLRAAMQTQMEVDEALRLLAELARTAFKDETRHAALRTVLQVHGVLSDKPMPPSSRQAIARQVAELVDEMKKAVGTKPGARAKIKAMLAIGVESQDEAAAVIESTGQPAAGKPTTAQTSVDLPALASAIESASEPETP